MIILSAVADAPSSALVITMGLGTVFVGLISIILICYLMGFVIRRVEGLKKQPAPAVSAPAEVKESAPAEIANKGELIAVVSAVLAEELGESVEAIRIKSIKRVS